MTTLSSEGIINSLDARRHLDWLLDKIEPLSDNLIELQKREEIEMWITCVWWSAHGHGGPMFWPIQLQKLGKLGLEFEIDCAFFGDAPENPTSANQ